MAAPPSRLTLIEIAPGLDLQRDVLAACGAPVAVAPDLSVMDERIFRVGAMGHGCATRA